jgi:hypothetical protein
MHEGWYGDDYFVLFDESEAVAASDRYEVLRLLPGFKVLGLRSWDDFIVRSAAGQIYSVPTPPLNARNLEKQYSFPFGADTHRAHISERYVKLLNDRAYRLDWAERVRTGFVFPVGQPGLLHPVRKTAFSPVSRVAPWNGRGLSGTGKSRGFELV